MDFLNPEQVLNQLELRENTTAADFGSGSGGWAIPLAKRLVSGRVYAVDIQEEALAVLKTKAETLKLNNIKPIRADLEQSLGSSIQNGLLDLVLLTNLLFQVKHQTEVLSEAKRVLRPGGRLLLVDWKPEALVGPTEGRIPLAQAKEMVQASGFEFEKEVSAGAYHYGLVFLKVA
jgi:ubiquinone/menaquinone biosynthesis C-methylase UbiE